MVVLSTDDERALPSATSNPQLRTVAPKYGKQLGGIQKALAALDGNAAMDELGEKGQLTLDIDGVMVELTKEDLLIDVAQKERYVTQEGNKMTVLLDNNLTEELIEDGFVYEVISKIQTMRKEAGFEVMDHIKVSVNENDKLAAIVKKNQETIAAKGVADSMTAGETYAVSKAWNINGQEAVISIEKWQ